MNTQKKLSLLIIVLVGIIVVFLGLAAWTLSKLPGAYEIRKAFTPSVLQNKEDSQEGEAAQKEVRDEHLREDLLKILNNDFANKQRPLVDACRFIEQAPSSRVFIHAPEASVQELQEALVSGKNDPVAESIVPVFRFLFRSSEIPTIVRQIETAEADMGLMDKTELYIRIYQSLSFLSDHEKDLNLLLQKSYDLNTLMRTVALNPPLAHDATVVNMCQHIEQSILSQGPFDIDKQATEITHLLQQNNISPQGVGFDPTYRAHILTDFSGTSFSLDEPWLSKIFAKDIEKIKHRHHGHGI